MEKARRTTIATLLLALAIVAFATATMTMTNITLWSVKAQGAPVVKVKGDDVDNKYVNVTWKIDTDGTNRTIISLIGFKGDPTTYTSVLGICNKNFSGSVTVYLVYRGLKNSTSWGNVRWIKILYDSSSWNLRSANIGDNITLGTLNRGDCKYIGVSVLVDANAPTQQEILAFELDVVSQKP